jgi:two-component system sensor histidine kinase DesK
VQDELAKARVALDAAGVTAITHAEPVALDVEAERALALGLREAVTNVVRHARARRCEITLIAGDGTAQLIVQDDGTGGSHPEGAGLSGMRARVVAAGGTVERDGRAGTRLTLTVPHGSGRQAERAAS